MKMIIKNICNEINKINQAAMLIMTIGSAAASAIAVAAYISFFIIDNKIFSEELYAGACRVLVIGVAIAVAVDLFSRNNESIT